MLFYTNGSTGRDKPMTCAYVRPDSPAATSGLVGRNGERLRRTDFSKSGIERLQSRRARENRAFSAIAGRPGKAPELSGRAGHSAAPKS
jgi:hypothetical protein